MTDRCKHGAEKERDREWPEGLIHDGPFGICRCCLSRFSYGDGSGRNVKHTDSKGVVREYLEGQRWELTDLCEFCGGDYKPYREFLSGPPEEAKSTIAERLARVQEEKALSGGSRRVLRCTHRVGTFHAMLSVTSRAARRTIQPDICPGAQSL